MGEVRGRIKSLLIKFTEAIRVWHDEFFKNMQLAGIENAEKYLKSTIGYLLVLFLLMPC
jgi:hypothetical protein